MTSPPTHAVIIPHYNDEARLRRCLDALGPQLVEGVEVMVADNATPGGIDAITRDYPWVACVTQTDKGAGPARNAGVAATTAPWLFFIDADCVPASDWLARGREIAEENAVIGGQVETFDETPGPRSGAEAFETVFAFQMQRYLEEEAFLGAGNLVTSRAVFDAVGGFRPAISEDKDWSRRAAQAGFRLAFDADFIVFHPSRQDWPALANKWRRLTRETYLLTDRSTAARAKWAVRALLMPVSAVVHVPRVIRHPELTATEKRRGLTTLFRIRLARMGWMLRQALTGRA